MTETIDYAQGATRPPLPAKVAAAIAAVMGDVPRLAKSEKNEHGRYNFASIDDFLEAVRPLCAKHGLIIMQDEESFEMVEAGKDRNGNDRKWLMMRFSYTLAHASGETWGHRPTRSIMVDASMGSQAFGAAQSYALKQFERSLFQIATGEKDADADAHPPADLPSGRARQPNGNGAARTATPKAEEGLPAWKKDAERLKVGIDMSETVDAVNQFVTDEGPVLLEIKKHSQSAYEFLMDRANKRRGVLTHGEKNAA